MNKVTYGHFLTKFKCECRMFYVLILIKFLVVFSFELTQNVAYHPNGETFNIVLRRKLVPTLHHSGRLSQKDDVVRFLRNTKDVVSVQNGRKQVRIKSHIVPTYHMFVFSDRILDPSI